MSEFTENVENQIIKFFKDLNAQTPPKTETTSSHIFLGIGGHKSTVLRVITNMAKDGLLTKVGTLKSKGAPALYSLTEILESLTTPDKETTPVVTKKKAAPRSPEFTEPIVDLKSPITAEELKHARTRDLSKPREIVVHEVDLVFEKKFDSVRGMHDVGTLPLYLEALEEQIHAIVRRTHILAEQQLMLAKQNNGAVTQANEAVNAVKVFDAWVAKNTDITGRQKSMIAAEKAFESVGHLAKDQVALAERFDEFAKGYNQFVMDVPELMAKILTENPNFIAQVFGDKPAGSDETQAAFERGYGKGYNAAMEAMKSDVLATLKAVGRI